MARLALGPGPQRDLSTIVHCVAVLMEYAGDALRRGLRGTSLGCSWRGCCHTRLPDVLRSHPALLDVLLAPADCARRPHLHFENLLRRAVPRPGASGRPQGCAACSCHWCRPRLTVGLAAPGRDATSGMLPVMPAPLKAAPCCKAAVVDTPSARVRARPPSASLPPGPPAAAAGALPVAHPDGLRGTKRGGGPACIPRAGPLEQAVHHGAPPPAHACSPGELRTGSGAGVAAWVCGSERACLPSTQGGTCGGACSPAPPRRSWQAPPGTGPLPLCHPDTPGPSLNPLSAGDCADRVAS